MKRTKTQRKEAATSPLSVLKSAGNDQIREERISFRAYQIYETRIRGDVPGDPVSDWLRAERELCGDERATRA